jgi:hypothetical protein
MDEKIKGVEGPVVKYATWLQQLAQGDSLCREMLRSKEASANEIIDSEQDSSNVCRYPHTIQMLEQLEREGDWNTLVFMARKHMDSDDKYLAVVARRKLALCLSNSEEDNDLQEAAEISSGTSEDAELGIALHIASENPEVGKELLLYAMEVYPENKGQWAALGTTLASHTGDRKLRGLIEDYLE